MFPDLNGQLGARLVITIVVVALALLVFFFLARAWRNRGSASFLRSGNSRQPRLAVLDTTAVDAKRRLVLVRRDEVEHLILIGGPTDLVIESRIGGSSPDAARPQTAAVSAAQPTPAPVVPRGERRETARPAAPAVETTLETPAAAVGERRNAVGQPASAPDAKVGSPVAAVMRESERPKPADQREPARPRQTDIADVLDDHRARVFGPSPAPRQDSTYVRAYADDGMAKAAPPTPVPPKGSVVRFDDFLDAEITGDLSKVTPLEPETASPPPTAPLRTVKAEPPRQPSPSLDDEMARLLGDISPKR